MRGWGELHKALIHIRCEYNLTIPDTLNLLKRVEKNYKDKITDKKGKLNYKKF